MKCQIPSSFPLLYTAPIQFAPCPFLLQWSVSPTWRWSAENAWSMTFNPCVLRGPERCLSRSSWKIQCFDLCGRGKDDREECVNPSCKYRICLKPYSWMQTYHILCVYIIYIHNQNIYQLQFGSLMFNFCHLGVLFTFEISGSHTGVDFHSSSGRDFLMRVIAGHQHREHAAEQL